MSADEGTTASNRLAHGGYAGGAEGKILIGGETADCELGCTGCGWCDADGTSTRLLTRWVEGRLYEEIEDKVEAVNAYLRELEADPGRVRSLAWWDWNNDTVRHLPSPIAAHS